VPPVAVVDPVALPMLSSRRGRNEKRKKEKEEREREWVLTLKKKNCKMKNDKENMHMC
jgi:hypothetical protein